MHGLLIGMTKVSGECQDALVGHRDDGIPVL